MVCWEGTGAALVAGLMWYTILGREKTCDDHWLGYHWKDFREISYLESRKKSTDHTNLRLKSDASNMLYTNVYVNLS